MLGWGFPPNITGGLDVHVGELFTGLRDDLGVDVTLVLPAEFAPDDEPGLEPVETGEGDVAARVGQLSDRFAELAPDHDVIHTHDWFGYGPGRSAARESDATWVSSFHSLASDRNIDPPSREVETERRLANAADTNIAVSEIVREDIRELYDADSRVVYNGFSTPKFSGKDVRADLDIDGEMLFFVGRHTDQKGISHLLYATKKLRGRDVTLVVGGSGHQTDQLKRFAELLGIEDRVEFVGYVPEAELGDYYAASDAFVSPSYAEPFGITITEALEAGTQVVATPSGVAEVLPDGCLVEVETDSESIVDGLIEALDREEPPRYERREWGDVAEDTLAVYEDVA
ncbi:glycosyltransferase family 4 protein [Halorubrum distributum]|uniref:glycosyltransferase family 4 protein n=1 Tax=Halorubrum distributum TaxID=29283 RepID=UPI0029534225|nr:glycosyltransferase family 4 protein [Halorubrum distributum]MDV7348648.1 glycosyltransferase family 4 protein [Halorubrum distributum]